MRQKFYPPPYPHPCKRTETPDYVPSRNTLTCMMSFKVCCQIFFHTSALLCHTSRSSWLGSLFSPATNINIRSDNRRKTHKRRLLVTRDLKTSVKFQLFFSLILTHMMRGAAIDIARLCTALAPTNIGDPQPLTYLLTYLLTYSTEQGPSWEAS